MECLKRKWLGVARKKRSSGGKEGEYGEDRREKIWELEQEARKWRLGRMEQDGRYREILVRVRERIEREREKGDDGVDDGRAQRRDERANTQRDPVLKKTGKVEE